MAGIYIHIPFCKQACHYCNFHFSTSLKLQNALSGALLKEIELRREYLGSSEVNTIYFGGGTPSLMPVKVLDQLLSTLRNYFTIGPDAEITLEANPDDINEAGLKEWRAIGFNRLSIGIQSFFEEDLRWMNRAHNASQARNCIALARDTGFSNMSIDLIYGGPTLSDEHWLENLTLAAGENIPHLSCYALTVEPGTALDVLTKKKKVAEVESEDQARQFLMMTDFLQARGYEHYEISNFALPGNKSRHNSSYWKGAHYLGIGPSAHSFNGNSRQWNVANNSIYIQSLAGNLLNFEKEELTAAQKLNEYLMTALRTSNGVDLNFIESNYGRKIAAEISGRAIKAVNQSWVMNDGKKLVLTRTGKLFADGIAADLFVEENYTNTDSMVLNP